MVKRSKEKRDRLIVLIIGTLAVVSGLWFGVIKTRRQQLEDSKGRLEEAKDKLDKAKARVQQAERVELEKEAAARKLKVIEQTMASGVDLYSWAYLLLEKTRAGHEVNIIDVTRPAKGEVGMLAQFPYDAAIFSVRGTAFYHQFGKFLADFENQFPFFRVQSLSLSPGSESSVASDDSSGRVGNEMLQFKMDIVALIKPTQ